MNNKETRILITIPTFENIEPACFKGVYGLERPDNTNIMFDYVKGYDCARARNMIVHEALEYNFDYVFMVDSDIVLPRFALKKLLSRDKDIILGWYLRKRTKTMQTELFALGQKNFTDENNINASTIPQDECIEIKGGGLGIALIKTSVFKELAQCKWFQYVEYDKVNVLSEDNFFCSIAAAKGFKIYYDSSVRGGHVSKVVL